MGTRGVRDFPCDGVGAVPAVSDLEAAGWVKVTPVRVLVGDAACRSGSTGAGVASVLTCTPRP